MNENSEVDYAWLAGIIDGEGNLDLSIREAGNGKPYFRPKVRVANTDLRMIVRIGEIWARDNLRFFYTINRRRRYNTKWKDQLHIEIASQGSAGRLLPRVIPHLSNKRIMAEQMLALIEYVQTQPKGGNTKSIRYVDHPEFRAAWDAFFAEKERYIDPSTITRRASCAIQLDDMI